MLDGQFLAATNAIFEPASATLERMRAYAPSALADQDLFAGDAAASATFAARAPLIVALERIVRASPAPRPSAVRLAFFAGYAARLAADGEVCIAVRKLDGAVPAGERFLPLPVGLTPTKTFLELAADASWALETMPDVATQGVFAQAAGVEAWTTAAPFGVTLVNGSAEGLARHPSDPDVHVVVGSDGGVVWSLSGDVRTAYAARLEERLLTFADAVAAGLDRPLADAPIMAAAERDLVVAKWNDTAVAYPQAGGLVDLLEAEARRAPDHPAVVFKDETLSYAVFNGRVNRLARALRAQGVGKDTFVCLCLDRSFEMVVAIWATLKAGGAYVPLNVDDPAQRQLEIVADCKPVVILTQARSQERFQGCDAPAIALDRDFDWDAADGRRDPGYDIDEADLAYMIYTSGSTGKPKGVLIEHAAILNRILWMHKAFDLKPDERVLQKTPYTFDVSVWEFLWAPVVGATIVVAEPGGHMAPGYLLGLIAEARVTHCHFVPSVLRIFMMMPGLDQLPLKQVFCSGEALGYDLQKDFLAQSGAELHNLYGPTEAAVDVSHWACAGETAEPRVPIGKTIDNVGLYILDANDRPVPIGAPGELHIGGVCLARGYWARPELTAERFIETPFAGAPHGRLYRTGDLARFLPSGDIEYLGRNDFQVKVHGIRIELGEIESAIRGHAMVRDVVVAAEGEGVAKALVGYVQPKTDVAGDLEAEITAELAKTLPDYMVPREFRFVAEMPLTVSGKIDRKRLAAHAAAEEAVLGIVAAA